MTRITPTQEQEVALLQYRTAENTVIEALAGTGKTSTLQMLARFKPDRQGYYLAFNRGVKLEADQKFGGTGVRPMTMHALALRNSPNFFRERLNGSRKFTHWGVIAKRAGIVDDFVFSPEHRPLFSKVKREVLANAVKETVDAFMKSADPELTADHVRIPKAVVASEEGITELSDLISEKSRIIWGDYVSPDGTLPMNHQAYIKHWQLGSPVLPVDFVFVDEAQDLDPLMVDVLLRQQCQMVTVGDPNQQIYSWRGARNSMDSFNANWRSSLTRSFRFGPAIAEEAQQWLRLLGSNLTIQGNPEKHSVLGIGAKRSEDAVICRTNAGAIVEIIEHLENNLVVAVAGDRKNDELRRMAQAADDLQQRGKSSHPDFQMFTSWDALVEFSESADGAELESFVTLVNKFKAKNIVTALERCVREGDESDVTVSTAHIAKGLEWGRVRVADDFVRPRKADEKRQEHTLPAEEARLSYVTVTRAMQGLDPGGLSWIHDLPTPIELT